ncbi:hypothetical protein MK805_17210 [Shimazuella sp. AN120528]|uniref:hypothetical protein n=1 Tax=Shimazuella soli TaxID=1892854 RepID=UPI001F0F0409|nr:hypothetical protein [Shimazuella soli]MCH5586677.1 hypothetical protein [Shimazuella soli]
MVNTFKKLPILFASLLLVLSFSFVAQPQKTEAYTCYKSGWSTFSTYWISPTFYYPGGYMKINITAYASKKQLWGLVYIRAMGALVVGLQETEVL